MERTCLVCTRPVAFGRKSSKTRERQYCGLCEAITQCDKLQHNEPNVEPVYVWSVKDIVRGEPGGDLIEELRSKYSGLQRAERVEAAWDWLWERLCQHCLELHVDRVNDIIVYGFGLNCWELYANLVNENKVYFVIGKAPRICLKPAWKPKRPYPGSFEAGKRR